MGNNGRGKPEQAMLTALDTRWTAEIGPTAGAGSGRTRQIGRKSLPHHEMVPGRRQRDGHLPPDRPGRVPAPSAAPATRFLGPSDRNQVSWSRTTLTLFFPVVPVRFSVTPTAELVFGFVSFSNSGTNWT